MPLPGAVTGGWALDDRSWEEKDFSAKEGRGGQRTPPLTPWPPLPWQDTQASPAQARQPLPGKQVRARRTQAALDASWAGTHSLSRGGWVAWAGPLASPSCHSLRDIQAAQAGGSQSQPSWPGVRAAPQPRPQDGWEPCPNPAVLTQPHPGSRLSLLWAGRALYSRRRDLATECNHAEPQCPHS